MEIDLTTPALLFSATSLILLAYTNRFLALAAIIRNLRKEYDMQGEQHGVIEQLKNLSKRIAIIKNMQFFGIMSLFMSIASMFLIYQRMSTLGDWAFGISCLMMLISLALSVWETNISANALEVFLSDIKDLKKSSNPHKK